MLKKYCIRGASQHRADYCYFDDTGFEDEHQKKLYQCASEIALANDVRSVYDVGCGSGHKLIHHPGQYETVGFDVAEALDYLRNTYPERSGALSTIDRKRKYSTFSRYQLGPTHRDHHMREWSFDEFNDCVSQFIDVLEHSHPTSEHATQMIVGVVRGRGQ